MADFPPNLDDGELWLPSDIFPDEVPAKCSPLYCSELGYMEDFSQRFAALALLEGHRSQTVAPVMERFGSPDCHGLFGSSPAGYHGSAGGVCVRRGITVYGYRGPSPGARPVCRSQLLYPVQTRVEGFLEARARVLGRQQDRFCRNRIFPFQRSGIGVDGGAGFAREYGGTGVFLPRIANSTYTATNAPRKRPGSSTIIVHCPLAGVKNSKEIKVTHPRNSVERVGVAKQEQRSLEMGLPQDWTY